MSEPTSGLSAEQVARYREDGFLVGVPILTPEEVAEARAELLAREAEERAKRGGTWPDRHHRPWERADHPLKELFHRLALHPRLLDAVASLLGPDLLIRNADVFIKEPGSARTVAWHLDTAVRDGTEDAYLTAWLGLGEDGATAENGGLRFLRGGHRAEIPDRPKDRDSLTFSAEAMSVIDPERVVQSVMPPGHASFHHACMPHFSGANRSARRRIGFVVRFMGAGISPAQAESGVAFLARGRPPAQGFSLRDDFPVSWYPQVP